LLRIPAYVIGAKNRHARHADILPELVDGAVGWRKDEGGLAPGTGPGGRASATLWSARKRKRGVRIRERESPSLAPPVVARSNAIRYTAPCTMANSTWNRPSRGLLTLAALGLLAERPRHTYGIQLQLQQRHKEFAAGTPRALYHAVDRLAAGGLIELAETVREGHRPERVVYRATDAGREEFQHWLIDLLAVPHEEPSTFSAAVSMIGYLPEREALGALAQRVAQLEGRIAAMDAVLSSLLDQFGMPRLFLLEREFERSLWRAELAWVTELIGELRSGELAVDQGWLQEHVGHTAPADAEPEAPLAVRAPKRRRGKVPAEGGPELRVHQGGNR